MLEMWTKTNENEFSTHIANIEQKNRIQFHPNEISIHDDNWNVWMSVCVNVFLCVLWQYVCMWWLFLCAILFQFRCQTYHWQLIIMFDIQFNLAAAAASTARNITFMRHEIYFSRPALLYFLLRSFSFVEIISGNGWMLNLDASRKLHASNAILE